MNILKKTWRTVSGQAARERDEAELNAHHCRNGRTREKLAAIEHENDAFDARQKAKASS